eukprot:1601202-Pleurochrysis_carterae.AAC.1
MPERSLSIEVSGDSSRSLMATHTSSSATSSRTGGRKAQSASLESACGEGSFEVEDHECR